MTKEEKTRLVALVIQACCIAFYAAESIELDVRMHDLRDELSHSKDEFRRFRIAQEYAIKVDRMKVIDGLLAPLDL